MDEPRTISKRAYHWLTLSVGILIAVVVGFVAVLLARAWRIRIEPGVLGGLSAMYMILARALVERYLRRRGLTRRGTVVEIHARAPFESCEDVAPGDMVEARLSRGFGAFILIGGPIMGLFLLAAWHILKEETWLRWIALAMGFFILIHSVANLLEYGKPQARVDADGVTGYPSPRALWRRFVPWSDIFSCEVRTTYDTFGKPILLRPIFKGRHGETLMELYLIYTPMIEQERIVKFIKTKLPETELDSWLL